MYQPDRFRILVVDDEEDLREIIVEQLQVLSGTPALNGRALEIQTAENGRDALKFTDSNWYDAILSDINMPLMTGLEFLGELRGRGKDVPLIFLTAFGDKGKVVEALRMGAYDFLDKPWKADHLRKVISEAIRLGEKLRKLEMELDSILEKLPGLTDEKRNQMRSVHRSILLLKADFDEQKPGKKVS